MHASFSLDSIVVYAPVDFLQVCRIVIPHLIIAHQGRMDLASWDIEKNGKNIAGWGMGILWQQAFNARKIFKRDSITKPDDYILVPGTWNDPVTNSKNFAGQFGYLQTNHLSLHRSRFAGSP